VELAEQQVVEQVVVQLAQALVEITEVHCSFLIHHQRSLSNPLLKP
jgi:hypothetical protein